MVMSILLGSLIGLVLLVYFLAHYVLNEKQLYQLRYTLYVGSVMLVALFTAPLFLVRPRHASNIRRAAIILNPVLSLFGMTYRVDNAKALPKDGPCVIVANHQSSIDFIGMMHLWPTHVGYCTILAKRELLWAGPFGLTAWLAGLEYVDRKNRERSSETMRQLTKKIQDQSLRLWIFPEGTRHMSDTMLPFKAGAFRSAIEAQIPIVPVVFSSYRNVYRADRETNTYYWRPGCVTIKCLEPIETKGMTVDNDLKRLSDMTRQRMIDTYAGLQTTTNDG